MKKLLVCLLIALSLHFCTIEKSRAGFLSNHFSKLALVCATALGTSASLAQDHRHQFNDEFIYPKEANHSDIAPAVSAAMPSVVQLSGTVAAGEAFATGFFVSDDGYILTALHFVDLFLSGSSRDFLDVRSAETGLENVRMIRVKDQAPKDLVFSIKVKDWNDRELATSAKVVFMGSAVIHDQNSDTAPVIQERLQRNRCKTLQY